jgi:hypothetical protein
MTNITLSTNNMQFVQLFEIWATTLNVPFKKVEKHIPLSKTMQKALEEEKKGDVTKLVNYKNAVAEILG